MVRVYLNVVCSRMKGTQEEMLQRFVKMYFIILKHVLLQSSHDLNT